MNHEELLFYDLEVFEYDSLAMFMDINANIIGTYWNNRGRKHIEDPSGFEGVAELISNKTLVGYNNYGYDDYILSVMMSGAKQDIIYAHNNTIIKSGGSPAKLDSRIRSLDTMQQISVSHPSLKQIEGNMGRSIVESSVDFNIGRPLTEEERKETELYCASDIRNTIEVFKLREKSYFDTKEALLDMLPEGTNVERARRWNTTTLSTNLLIGSKKIPQWLDLKVPGKYWRSPELQIPDEVWDLWEDGNKEENLMRKGKSISLDRFGCKVTIAMGGLHGAPIKPRRYKDIKLADVGSMYPSIICALDALGPATKTYDGIRTERLRIKHTDKTRADALKLILNSVYGLFKSKYSNLCNPRASATVCIYGQIALYTLSRWLHEAGYEVMNINTDGVAFVDNPDLNKRYEGICQKWEAEFKGMALEIDEFERWIQKDVNNYIAVGYDGHIKVKGGDVNKYFSDKFFSNNDCRIIQKAVVDKLVYNKDPLDTLMDHINEPLLYQYVLKAGSTYLGVQDSNGKWQNKVNRVFATREGPDSTKLYKIRQDGGRVNFPDVPDHMFLWNQDVHDIHDFEKIVDIEHYHQIITKKLKGWDADVC